MRKVDHPVMLIVLDGWGYSEKSSFNAIASANKPTWDHIWSNYPNLLIDCSGSAVGLPDEQMGNSEVGHMHLGAGRTVNQDFTRISRALMDRSFFADSTLKPALSRAAETANAFHILGLISRGGVHSHEEHVMACVELAASCGVQNIYIHAFLDGRDTPPRSAAASLRRLQDKCAEIGRGEIASIVGRYYAMDRNANWDRIDLAYHLIVDGHAAHQASDPLAALEDAYTRGENDEFVAPTSILLADSHIAKVNDGDVVFFANFRADRARQLTTAITEPTFADFPRNRMVTLGAFITMTSYGEQYDLPTMFSSTDLHNTYGEWVASHGLRQLRIAETEKYAHVTFFFNGGRDEPSPGEDRVLVPSPNVATYDLQPEMSAREVTDALVKAITSESYDTVICNYANADMVGHTGNFDATVSSIETLDSCLARVITAAKAHGMEILITADHGNAEKMRAHDSDQAHTAHTENLVPLVYLGRPADIALTGCLSDIAPTMLTLMGISIPPEMTGKSLVVLKQR